MRDRERERDRVRERQRETKGVANKKLKKDVGHFMMEDLPELIIKKYLDKKE